MTGRRSDVNGGSSPGPAGLTLDRAVEAVGSSLRDRDDVAFAYVFGSVAKGRVRRGSDIDVAVMLTTEPDMEPDAARIASRAIDLESVLERRIGRPVQVVALNTAPPDLVQNVLGHGRLAFSRDDALRRAHYLQHARTYYDMAYARDVFDRRRVRRLEEGTFGGGAPDRT